MYSKCIVEPFRRHPIAMTASNGLVEEVVFSVGAAGFSVDEEVESMRDKRFVVEASIEGAAWAD
jgi:hypothetical protein